MPLSGFFAAPPRLVTDVTRWVVQHIAHATLVNVELALHRRGRWIDPTEVTDLLLLRTRCLALLGGSDIADDCKRADRNTSIVCSRTFKVDLRDWTYLRSAPTKRSKHTLKVSLKFVTRRILAAEAHITLGEYSGDPRGIGPKPQIILYLRNVSVLPSSSVFEQTLRDAVETMRHELQHYSQVLLKTELGLRDEAGLPPRSARERDFNINASELLHTDRDAEFQTNLQSAVSKIRRRLQRVSPQRRRDLLREILSSYVGEHYRSSAKGRAAASTLYAAVADLLPSS